jgi:hypothetical protein
VSSLTWWVSLSAAFLLFLPGVAQAQANSGGSSLESASDAPRAPPEAVPLRLEPQAPLVQEDPEAAEDPGAAEEPEALPPEAAPAATASAEQGGVLVEGKVRQGAFLSGPGSLTFILHHSVMGGLGGFATQAIPRRFEFDKGDREAMLAGTLIGAGLGFASAAWWQFNHWVDRPVGYFGIANSVIGGMALGGFADLLTRDASTLTWASFIGAELGAWLTASIGGGQMPLEDGLLVASGGAWGAIYSALLLAIVHFSGTKITGKTFTDVLLLAPGLGATALAMATTKYSPTASQILRADVFGAGVGAVVLVVSALVLGGFNEPTPYVLAFLGSAGAITTVSMLWEEAAERPKASLGSGSSKRKAYRGLW